MHRSLVPATLVFAAIHFTVQLAALFAGFTGGGANTFVYTLCSVVFFPVVYLAEKYNISGLGMMAFLLNTCCWTAVFYGLMRILKPGTIRG
jgi:hypothetical protein